MRKHFQILIFPHLLSQETFVTEAASRKQISSKNIFVPEQTSALQLKTGANTICFSALKHQPRFTVFTANNITALHTDNQLHREFVDQSGQRPEPYYIY